MAAFSTQTLDNLGGALTFSASSATDTCDVPTTAGSMFLVFKGGAGSNTITITVTQTTQYARALPAPGTAGSYTLGTGSGTTLFIPLYPEFGGSGNTITINNSASASVTMAVVRF